MCGGRTFGICVDTLGRNVGLLICFGKYVCCKTEASLELVTPLVGDTTPLDGGIIVLPITFGNVRLSPTGVVTVSTWDVWGVTLVSTVLGLGDQGWLGLDGLVLLRNSIIILEYTFRFNEKKR